MSTCIKRPPPNTDTHMHTHSHMQPLSDTHAHPTDAHPCPRPPGTSQSFCRLQSTPRTAAQRTPPQWLPDHLCGDGRLWALSQPLSQAKCQVRVIHLLHLWWLFWLLWVLLKRVLCPRCDACMHGCAGVCTCVCV